MRHAVIDNASLTAVQRLLGEIPIVNKYSTDGDIAAFEQFIQAILLYDNLYYLDDYKEKYKESRKKFFHYLRPISVSLKSQDLLMRLSREKTADIGLKVKAGEISDEDFKEFFDLLKMHSVFTWDQASSDFYLTIRMLYGLNDSCGIEKYSSFFQMIFSELYDARQTLKDRKSGYRSIRDSQFISKDGRDVGEPFKEGHRNFQLSDQVKAFSSSLSWLSFRTSYYSLFGLDKGLTPILHPIRQSFQINFAEKGLGFPKRRMKGVIDYLAGESLAILQEIRDVADPVTVVNKLPIFTAWVASKVDSPKNYIEEAYRLREQKEFVNLRAKFREIEDLSADQEYPDFLKSANKIKQDIDKEANKLLEKYGVKTKQGLSVAPVINVFLAAKGIPKIPDLGIKVPLPTMVHEKIDQVKDLWPKSAYKVVFRSLVEDLACIERLGELRTKIASCVQKDTSVAHSYSDWEATNKIEHVNEFGEERDFRRPM